jgi:Uma2 family endonuclease
MTVEEFARIAPHLDGPSELVEGRLRLLSPTGPVHGVVVFALTALTARWLAGFPPGEEPVIGFGAETGFRVADPKRPVLAPDLAFVRRERAPAQQKDEGFFDGAPDFAAEVRSPGDAVREVRDKERAWLAAGTRLVWSIDPRARTVRVLRADGSITTVGLGGALAGDDVLPGLQIAVDDLFVRLR